jgi:hypothetical protein
MRLLGNILAVDRPPYSAILSLTAHDPSLLVRAVGASLTITTRLRLFCRCAAAEETRLAGLRCGLSLENFKPLTIDALGEIRCRPQTAEPCQARISRSPSA